MADCDDPLSPDALPVFRLRRDTGGPDSVRTSMGIVYGIASTSPAPAAISTTAAPQAFEYLATVLMANVATFLEIDVGQQRAAGR